MINKQPVYGKIVMVLVIKLINVCVCVLAHSRPGRPDGLCFTFLLVTHHVIMAPGNPCNYYQHRVVQRELNIEAQHHGNNSRECVPRQGPHNVSMSTGKGEPVKLMEK